MCMKYDYEIGIGNQGESSEFAEKKLYHFYGDSDARQFINLLNTSLKEEGKEVTYFNKIKKENIYHIVNRLCESLQETLDFDFIEQLFVRKEGVSTFIDVRDKASESVQWTIDITSCKSGAEIIFEVVSELMPKLWGKHTYVAVMEDDEDDDEMEIE